MSYKRSETTLPRYGAPSQIKNYYNIVIINELFFVVNHTISTIAPISILSSLRILQDIVQQLS